MAPCFIQSSVELLRHCSCLVFADFFTGLPFVCSASSLAACAARKRQRACVSHFIIRCAEGLAFQGITEEGGNSPVVSPCRPVFTPIAFAALTLLQSMHNLSCSVMSKCPFKFPKNTVVILTPTAHFVQPICADMSVLVFKEGAVETCTDPEKQAAGIGAEGAET